MRREIIKFIIPLQENAVGYKIFNQVANAILIIPIK